MIVLAIDPSIAATGYAIIDTDKKTIISKWIRTKPVKVGLKSIADVDRSRVIARALMVAVDYYNVRFIVSEISTGSQSASAGKYLGMVKGIIASLVEFAQLPAVFYIPSRAKKILTGDSKAEKSDVALAVESYCRVNKYKWKMEGEKYNRNGKATPCYEAQCDAVSIFVAAQMEGKFDG